MPKHIAVIGSTEERFKKGRAYGSAAEFTGGWRQGAVANHHRCELRFPLLDPKHMKPARIRYEDLREYKSKDCAPMHDGGKAEA